MISDKPLVSIGMPVYNGESYIRQALKSLLAQDYEHFELIISDNASTDQTGEICREYAAHNPRVVYYRNDENMGAAWNFKRVLELAKGKYFMWAAHDDLWDINYLKECIYILQVNLEAVLCCASLHFIDADGNTINKEHPNLDTIGMNLRQRVKALINQRGWFAIYSVIRTNILRQTNVANNVWGNDVILQLELLLHGNFARTTETQFHYRLVNKTAKDYDISIDPSRRANYLIAPYTQMVTNMLRVVRTSKLSVLEKVFLHYDILLSSLFTGPDLPAYIRRENLCQLFDGYRLQRMDIVRKVMLLAFLLNPRLLFSPTAWWISIRAVTKV